MSRKKIRVSIAQPWLRLRDDLDPEVTGTVEDGGFHGGQSTTGALEV